MNQVWKLIEAGIYVTTYHGVELRCRWTKSGWIVSKRADAEAKAFALVDK